MTCKTIFEKRGKYTFKDENGKKYRFTSLEAAVDAGGIAPKEKVQVSGVPYTVPAKDVVIPPKEVDIPEAIDDAEDVVSDYEDGEE